MGELRLPHERLTIFARMKWKPLGGERERFGDETIDG
jgi:hypothetical protein